MKNRTITSLGVVAILSLGLVGADSGCTKAQQHFALDAALNASQIACIFQSQISDAQELKTFCNITQDFDPQLLHNLIGQREAARRAGVRWTGPTDAGAE